MSDPEDHFDTEPTIGTEFSDADVFELVYRGPDVETGSMSARQVVEVVTGLSRAFSTVAHDRDLGDKYELRIRDIDHASIHLVFEAAAFVKANPTTSGILVAAAGVAVTGATNMTSGIYKVITDISASIEAKRKLKGSRIGLLPTVFADSGVSVESSEGTVLLTKEQYELLLSQRIDRPLAQIVSPLAADRINSFEIRRNEEELVRVAASQRDYFDYVEVTEEKNREGTEILGTLNSLTKTNLRGTFYTSDGVHVPYKYTGGNLQVLFRGFSANEPLRVRGRIKYGGDGIPTFVEIEEIEFLQQSFQN